MKSQSEIQKEFDELSSKLIEFLNDNYHPHAHIIITTDSAEISEGVLCNHNDKYIKG